METTLIKFYELEVGEVFIQMGFMFRVSNIDNGRTYFRQVRGGRRFHLGTFSQERVLKVTSDISVIPKERKPIRSKYASLGDIEVGQKKVFLGIDRNIIRSAVRNWEKRMNIRDRKFRCSTVREGALIRRIK